ncbi:hypothetical protein Tco_0531401 [Tanacetum coccineum]
MASGGSERDAKDALSKLLQMGTVAEYQNESNPTTLGEPFLLARAAKARFTNLQLLELLRSNPTTLGEAFFRAPIIEARFENENNQAVDNNVGDQQDPNVNDKQEILALEIDYPNDNDARDQASELETKVLVDGKQDDAKVVKVVGVTDEQNSDEPNMLEGNGVIGVGVYENNNGVDKEVQYSVYILHVLISFLKHLNDKCIKKKKMEAEIQRRIWKPGINIFF